MGWISAVDLIQTVSRSFAACGVPVESEVSKSKSMPSGDLTLVCLDGFDFIKRCWHQLDAKESMEHQRFVEVFERLKLPLTAGKR
eukprot:2641501-Amphidinium_carterae.1